MQLNLCLISEFEKNIFEHSKDFGGGGGFKTRSKRLIGKDGDREIYLHTKEKMHQG